MKKVLLILSGILQFAGGLAHADQATEQAVIETFIDTNAHTKKNLKGVADSVAKEGSLEFWSSGELLNEVKAVSTP